MTPLRKHSGKRVFPLADTLRFLMFPSLRFQRNRNTFLHVSDRFPFQESRISAIVNVCLCCGNAIFRTGNLLFRSFYWRKREDTVRQPDLSGNILTLLTWCSKLLAILYDQCKDSNAKIHQQKSMALVLHNLSLLKLFMCFMYTFFTSHKINRYF